MGKLTKRDKLVLAGLFLSKFDEAGLKILGFNGFSEAFNTFAISQDSSPASLKNYRDEFDPYFSNRRRGWHKRPIRQYCKDIMDKFGDMNIHQFTELIKSEFSNAGELVFIEEEISALKSNSFANRLATGKAAEKYFEKVYKNEPLFQRCKLSNTTALGCGFDYKMTPNTGLYYAVEVKGMTALSGTIQMTNKEHRVAELFEDRFYLFVVRNFVDKPFHTMIQNPVASELVFERHEVVSTQVSWITSVGG